MKRVHALRPLLEQRTEWADRGRRVHADAPPALRESGWFDLYPVKRAGGPGLPNPAVADGRASIWNSPMGDIV